MHDIICVRAVPELYPFYKKYIHIENVCIFMFWYCLPYYL